MGSASADEITFCAVPGKVWSQSLVTTPQISVQVYAQRMAAGSVHLWFVVKASRSQRLRQLFASHLRNGPNPSVFRLADESAGNEVVLPLVLAGEREPRHGRMLAIFAHTFVVQPGRRLRLTVPLFDIDARFKLPEASAIPLERILFQDGTTMVTTSDLVECGDVTLVRVGCSPSAFQIMSEHDADPLPFRVVIDPHWTHYGSHYETPHGLVAITTGCARVDSVSCSCTRL